MARLDYFAPGVYIEEVDRGSRPIEGVQTNVGGFIGFTEAIRNGADIGKPMLITSWDQYCLYFAREGSDGFTDFGAYLPFAVNGWFLNGGARCYVISIGTRIPGTEARQEITGAEIRTNSGRPTLWFALRPGWKGADKPDEPVTVLIKDGEPRSLDLEADDNEEPPLSDEYFTLLISKRKFDESPEQDPNPLRFENLTMGTTSRWGTNVREALESNERNIYVNFVEPSRREQERILPEGRATPSAISLRPANGKYQVRPIIEEYSQPQFFSKVIGDRDEKLNLQGSFEIDEINILAFPDLMKAYQENVLTIDAVHGIMERMVSYCETANPNRPNRMVVLDPPPEKKKPQEVGDWLENDFGRRSDYAALYYPWIKVPNPRNEGKPILVPPCGHVMGVWARTDETRGVYKAPANETPRGVTDLAYNTNFREQEYLNPKGINCICKFPGSRGGIKVWGARTLVEPYKTDWRYISVRRLMSYIEKSIEQGTQWVVFEPNDQDLWARVRRTVNNFLERIWREGALYGATPEQAFYVKCDETNNTSETMILGRLYVEVGVCPVRPAEFVIFRISQWNGSDAE